MNVLALNRRLSRGACAILLSLCLTSYGCGFSSFVAAAEADLPIVIQMVTNITNVVAPGVSAEIATAGGLALAALQIVCGTPAIGATECTPGSLVGQYYAATDSATKASVLQKMQAALATVNTHLSDMLKLAGSLATPSISAAISTAVGLALSTITAIMSMMPAATATTTAGMKAAAAKAVPPPKPAQLKAAFNTAIAQWPTAAVH